MSVLVPIIDYIDGYTRRVYLKSGVTDIYPIEDIYHEYRNLRRTVESLQKWSPLLRAEGNISKGAGKYTSRYVVLIDGTKIVPFDEATQLNQLGDIITDDPVSDATLYDVSTLTTAKHIFIQPPGAEVIRLDNVAIEQSSYNNGVTLDTVNGTDSSIYPYGTPRYPCKTITNSYMIRLERGFKKVYLKSDLVLENIPDGVLTDLELIGVTGFKKHTLTGNNVLITNCTAENIIVTGNVKPGSIVKIQKCTVTNLLNATMEATKCFIFGGIYKNTELFNCRVEGDIKVVEGGRFSGINVVFEGDSSSIDCLNSKTTINLDIDSGYVNIKNSTPECLLEFNLRGGELELDGTCNGGEFYAEGYGTLYGDPISLGMNVKSNHLLSLESLPIALWNQLLETGYTAKDLINILTSVSVGKTTILNNGINEATIIFRNISDTKDSVIADMNGSERTNITLNP